MKPTIWLIDDDGLVVDSLQCLLESYGRYVESFTLPESFLLSYDPTRPGCIIVDERMPGMCGWEVLEELLRRRAPSPTILMTNSLSEDVGREAARLGTVAVLEKPFGDRELFDTIEEALRTDFQARKRLRDRNHLQVAGERSPEA